MNRFLNILNQSLYPRLPIGLQNLACSAPWEPKPLETTRSSSFVASIEEQGSMVCFEIGLGPDGDLTWMIIPRQLALAIVGTMLVPVFYAADSVEYLEPDEPVLALEIDGDARAYPLE